MKLAQKKEVLPSTGCLFLFALPFAGVGIFMLWMVISTLVEWHQAKQWVENPAYILETDLITRSGSSSGSSKKTKTYQVTARYRYTFNNKTYESTKISVDVRGSDNIGNFHQAIYAELATYREKDQPFRCYINPDNPAETVLYRNVRWNLLGFFMIFVVVFGSFGLTILIATATRTSLGDNSSKLIEKYPDQPWLHRPEWQSKRISSNNSTRFFGITTATIAWNILSFPAWVILYGILNEGDYSSLWIAIFPLIGLLLIWKIVYLLLRRRKFGDVVLELDVVPCVPGSDLRGKIQIPITFNISQGITLKLKCINNVTTRSDKGQINKLKLLWKAEQVVYDGQFWNKTHLVFPINFKIPAEVRATDETNPDDKVFWHLEAYAELPGVNFSEEFDIPVFHPL